MTTRSMWIGAAAVLMLTGAGLGALQIRRLSTANAQPSFAAVRASYRPSDVTLLDRHGEVIHELRLDQTRRRLAWTPLTDISPALAQAVIAAEDRRFYTHRGVDWKAFGAAALQRLGGGPPRGASTISMQLATLLDERLQRAGGPRSLRQKWAQMRAAWALETQWSKEEILEAYLNLLTFRGELQGVTAAARLLFGKVPHGITAPEALVLAVLPRAPNAERDAVVRRAWDLRGALADVSRPEIERTATQALERPVLNGPRIALAPHVAHRLLTSAGDLAPVQSTLDAELQRVVRDALRRQLIALHPRRVQDGAALVVDNASGDVLAYVGSGAELSSARFVDGVRMRRQAGSVLKPFLYGLALDEHLLTPASLIADTPLELPVSGGLYRPQNYDEQFRGTVSLRTALSASLNIPAVRTLGVVGADVYVDRLRRLGFAGLNHAGDYYGPSLALGSADVSLWELVGAYRALANGGVSSPLHLMPTAEATADSDRVYSVATAFLLSDILSDRESRSVTFGLENPLATRFWTAVKTGTSKEMRDNWCVGFSHDYTVGVWVGNFSGEPMRDVSGISGAAPLWLDVMEWLHRRAASPPPLPPDDVAAQVVTFPPNTEPARREWFARGTEPPSADQSYARRRPHVEAPVSGTIIAIDPDIPPPLQRVLFAAADVHEPLRWQLDGAAIAPAKTYLWNPQRGAHALALIDAQDRVVDRVSFTVR